MKNYLRIILSIFCLFSINAFATSYSIIIDAGSSGSRLHLFAHETSKTNGVPLIAEIFSANTKPGIATFATNSEAAGASYKQMLDDAMAFMKTKEINPQEVKIDVLATAGMRLLSEHDQHEIYRSISAYIKDNYPIKIDRIETITGKMEGLYGWLDVNYLANNFSSEKTSGAIDIGGASTEIAFATTEGGYASDKVKLRINGKNYTVFSKSFLGLGQDVARDEMNEDLIAKSCYPVAYPLTATTFGDFNFNACQEVYRTILQNYSPSIDIPSTRDQSFIAYSGAYYDYQFIGADKNPDQSNVENHIQKTCKVTWQDFQKDHPNDAAKYLSSYCANATYVTTLLNDTYHLQDGQLTVSNRINSQEINWALGALLYELIG